MWKLCVCAHDVWTDADHQVLILEFEMATSS